MHACPVDIEDSHKQCIVSPGIFLRILWCSQTGNGQEINLAKFGCILDMQVEKNGMLLYSWLPTGTYHKNLVNLGLFFSWKILCIRWNHIFQFKISQNFNNRRNIDSAVCFIASKFQMATTAYGWVSISDFFGGAKISHLSFFKNPKQYVQGNFFKNFQKNQPWVWRLFFLKRSRRICQDFWLSFFEIAIFSQ